MQTQWWNTFCTWRFIPLSLFTNKNSYKFKKSALQPKPDPHFWLSYITNTKTKAWLCSFPSQPHFKSDFKTAKKRKMNHVARQQMTKHCGATSTAQTSFPWLWVSSKTSAENIHAACQTGPNLLITNCPTWTVCVRFLILERQTRSSQIHTDYDVKRRVSFLKFLLQK